MANKISSSGAGSGVNLANMCFGTSPFAPHTMSCAMKDNCLDSCSDNCAADAASALDCAPQEEVSAPSTPSRGSCFGRIYNGFMLPTPPPNFTLGGGYAQSCTEVHVFCCEG